MEIKNINSRFGGVRGFIIFSLFVSILLYAGAVKIYKKSNQASFNKYQTYLPASLVTMIEKSASAADQKGEIQKLNEQLKKSSQSYIELKSIGSKKKTFAAIEKTIKKRADLLLSLMEKEPESANQIAFTEQDKNILSKDIAAMLEKNIDTEGMLEVLIEEDFKNKKAISKFFLETPDGERHKLYMPLMSKSFISGQRLKVKGIKLGQNIAAASQSLDGVQVLAEPVIAASASDTKRTAVIMVNFQNDTSQSWTTEQVKDIFFTRANAYYPENSYNKLDLTGDAFGYYTLPIDKTCDDYSIKSEAINLSGPDIYFPNYDTIVFVGSFGCSWAGIAYVGSVGNNTDDGHVTAGNAWIDFDSLNNLVVGHELGHTYGVWHANFYDCDEAALKQSGCFSVNYGDKFDIMASTVAHMNGYHKEALGFLDSADMISVASSGSYTISPIETANPGPKVLKIDRGNGTYLYVEYRQPIGLDSEFSSVVFDGALIHIAPWFLGASDDTQLLDMTPTSVNSSNDSTLEVGKSFTDPGVATIMVTSQNIGTLTVDITIRPPVVFIYSPVSGAMASGTIFVEVNASDDVGVSHTQLFVDGVLIATDPSLPYGFSWDTKTVSNGSHVLTAKAYDSNGNSTLSEPVNIIIDNDITDPTVFISSPYKGTVVLGTINVLINASDDVGVSHTQLFVDGVLIATDPSLPYGFSWDTKTVSNGSHVLTAKAYDSAGNSSTSGTVNVTVINADKIVPIVFISSPVNGAMTSGTISVTASASDNGKVNYVQFYVDGRLKTMDYFLPYGFSWDTKTVSNGSHVLTAKAYDSAGNSSTSGAVNVTVINAPLR